MNEIGEPGLVILNCFAAAPAGFKCERILLAAVAAWPDDIGDGSVLVIADDFVRPGFILLVFQPHLRQRGFERQFAKRSGSVHVENLHRDARMAQQVGDDVGVGKVRGGIDAFHGYGEFAGELLVLGPESHIAR